MYLINRVVIISKITNYLKGMMFCQNNLMWQSHTKKLSSLRGHFIINSKNSEFTQSVPKTLTFCTICL